MKKIVQICLLLATTLISQSLQAAKITWNNKTNKAYKIIVHDIRKEFFKGTEYQHEIISRAHETNSFDNGYHAIVYFTFEGIDYKSSLEKLGVSNYAIFNNGKELVDVLLEWNQGLVFDIDEINGQPVLTLKEYRN